ncbi:hypothetical protein EKH55_2485 [Sinorhizobium alkalisoli]|nr:hypothetical protein EKH55_2485 [Sinorhizobium alkalisoli]
MPSFRDSHALCRFALGSMVEAKLAAVDGNLQSLVLTEY